MSWGTRSDDAWREGETIFREAAETDYLTQRGLRDGER